MLYGSVGRVGLRTVAGDSTPGGPASVLLLTTGSGLLLTDGTSFLKLASSS